MKKTNFFKKSALIMALIVLLSVFNVVAIDASESIAVASTYNHGEDLTGIGVSTSGKVNLKFYYSDFGTAEKMIAEITDPAGNDVRTIEYSVKDLNGNMVSVPLAPVEMTYNVKVYASSENGNGTSVEYSVKKYAEAVLANAEHAQYHDTMRALLNWGAMSQINFNVATDALASDGLFARSSNPIDAVTEIPFTETDAALTEGSAITNGMLHLLLGEDNLALRFYVNYSGEAENLIATIQRDAVDNGEALNETVTATKTQDGRYLVQIDNIGVTLFDKVYTIKFDDNNGNTFTARKSVLEYLNYLSINSDSETEQDTVRSLYQFYQLAAGTVDTDNCAHSAEYWANGDTGDILKCSECFAQLLSNPVPESITKYFSASEIVNGASIPSGVARTLETENGSYYSQMDITVTGEKDFIWKRSQADYKKATGVHGNSPDIEVGKAKYFVIKLRSSDIASTNSSSAAFFLRFSTTGKNGDGYAVAEDGTVTIPTADGYTYVRFLANAISTEWTTFVVDLAETCPDYYVMDETTGEYVIDTFWLYRNCTATGTIDIEYMAFAENWSAIEAIAGDTATVKQIIDAGKGTNTSVSLPRCADGHTVVEEINANTYSYVCSVCGKTLSSKTISTGVTKYFSASEIATDFLSYDACTDHSLEHDETIPYAHLLGEPSDKNQIAEIFLLRDNADRKNGDGKTNGETVNVGDAKYFVIKARSSDIDNKLIIYFSTTGKSTDGTNHGYIGVSFVFTDITDEDGWVTYVADLSAILPDHYIAADGTYLIDTFYLYKENFSSDESLDIAYMAFVDGDWAEISALTGETTVRQMTDRGNFKTVNTADGTAVTE